MRDLSKEPVKYLFVDGVNFRMRVARKIEIVPVLVAIGVAETGQKLVLGFQSGDKESASAGGSSSRISNEWARWFKGAFWVSWMGCRDWRPYSTKNFPGHGPTLPGPCGSQRTGQGAQKLKGIADEIRSIFYASSQRRRWNSSTASKKWKGASLRCEVS